MLVPSIDRQGLDLYNEKSVKQVYKNIKMLMDVYTLSLQGSTLLRVIVHPTKPMIRLNEANCSNVSRGKDSLTPTFRAILSFFCHLFLATPKTHLQESKIFYFGTISSHSLCLECIAHGIHASLFVSIKCKYIHCSNIF